MDQLAHQADLGLRHVQRVALRRLGHDVRLRTVVWAGSQGLWTYGAVASPCCASALPLCDRQTGVCTPPECARGNHVRELSLRKKESS